MCFNDQFDRLESEYWTPYPFAWLFFGSKSNSFGHFGTFLAHIGGFCLNELPNQFGSNLFSSFVFLRSIYPTRQDFLKLLSLCLTFFLVQKVTFQATLIHLRHILEDFYRITCHIILGVIYSFSVCFCGQFDLLEGKFWDCYSFRWLFLLAQKVKF